MKTVKGPRGAEEQVAFGAAFFVTVTNGGTYRPGFQVDITDEGSTKYHQVHGSLESAKQSLRVAMQLWEVTLMGDKERREAITQLVDALRRTHEPTR